MARRDLSRLLRPRSIAVIGGGAWASGVVEACRTIGFTGPIWPVHPKKREVAGLTTVPRIEDLPDGPDAVMIAINRKATVEAAEVLAGIGAGGAVCFASGFAEAATEMPDGPDLQCKLLAAAGEMPILGPNCYGFIDALDGAALWPDQHGLTRVETGVAILTQSSNIALNITMQRRGLPVAYVITCGNMAQIGMADIAAALAEDPRVTAIGLHIEGVGDLDAFEAMAATVHRNKTPVVALKAGMTEAGGAAGLSHTASLAGSGDGARALLERLGIARVDTLPELLETLKLLHVAGPLASNRIVSVSCSGGEAGLMADAASKRDLDLPGLTERQECGLRAALGPAVALSNPLDYHTYIWGDVPAMAATFGAMMSERPGLATIIVDFPRADRCDPSAWVSVLLAAEAAAEETGTTAAIVATLPENMPEETAEDAMDRGIVPLCGLDDALVAAEAAAWLGRTRPNPVPLLKPGTGRSSYVTLGEAEAKEALGGFGLHTPLAIRAESAEAAARAARDIGFPVVLKGGGVAHKTEAGAVCLNLASATEVEVAAHAMASETLLVEQMVTGGSAELLIGVRRDPAHGYVLTLGAGGVLTELMADVRSLLLPVTDTEIEGALRALRLWPLLEGYRGSPSADLGCVINAVQAVAAYVATYAGEIEEAEVNPLICGPNFAVAADALIRLRGTRAP